MIAKAKAEKRPIIFISDDAKEDWWWIHKGRKLGPRPELVEEFMAESDQDFHIYEFSQFLRFAADRFPEIKANVEKVEESLLADEKARRRQSDAAESKSAEMKLRQLEDERDQLIAALSGTPGSSALSISADRSALRARLSELNTEIDLLSQEPREAPSDAPASNEETEA
jgi:PIN domain-containing protein